MTPSKLDNATAVCRCLVWIILSHCDISNVIIGFFFGFVGVYSESWEVPFEEISDLQWVGSGAQGAVFLGKFHGEEVAVKKVRDIKETEIKHLRKLKHPNIITFK